VSEREARERGVLRSSRFNERLNRRIDFVMWSLLRDELTFRP